MNVDDAARKSGQHLFLQNPHETSENDNFHFGILQHLDQLCFYLRFEPGSKMPWRKVGVRQSELARDLENRRIQDIGNHDGGLGFNFPSRMLWRIARQFDPLPEPRIPILIITLAQFSLATPRLSSLSRTE